MMLRRKLFSALAVAVSEAVAKISPVKTPIPKPRFPGPSEEIWKGLNYTEWSLLHGLWEVAGEVQVWPYFSGKGKDIQQHPDVFGHATIVQPNWNHGFELEMDALRRGSKIPEGSFDLMLEKGALYLTKCFPSFGIKIRSYRVSEFWSRIFEHDNVSKYFPEERRSWNSKDFYSRFHEAYVRSSLEKLNTIGPNAPYSAVLLSDASGYVQDGRGEVLARWERGGQASDCVFKVYKTFEKASV